MTLPPPSSRVRLYLAGVVGFRYGLLALGYWVGRERLTGNVAHDVVERYASIGTFAVLFAVMAVLALGGALFPSDRGTRILLWFSAMLSTLFGIGLLLTWTWTPALAAFLPFVVGDLILAGMDLSPRRSEAR